MTMTPEPDFLFDRDNNRAGDRGQEKTGDGSLSQKDLCGRYVKQAGCTAVQPAFLIQYGCDC